MALGACRRAVEQTALRDGWRGGWRVSIEDRWNTVRTECCVWHFVREGKNTRCQLVGYDLTPSNYGRCAAWGASADGYYNTCTAQERRGRRRRRRQAPVDQAERAKSNQCDQSPTSIAFSGATVAVTDDDDAVAHIIFYGSLAKQYESLSGGLRAISTLLRKTIW